MSGARRITVLIMRLGSSPDRAPALVWASSEDFNLSPGALDWQISFL